MIFAALFILCFSLKFQNDPLPNFLATSKPNGKREQDRYDFAWLKLSEDRLAEYKSFDYITASQIVSNPHHPGKNLHLALGYPNSKNKRHDNVSHFVTPMYMTYSSLIIEAPELSREYGITGNSHLFLSHDKKHSKNSAGAIVNSLSPRGASGGALIDMGQVAGPESLLPGHLPRGKLAGMLIKMPRKHNVLVAVKIRVILNQIVRNAI